MTNLQENKQLAERFVQHWSARLSLPTSTFLADYSSDVQWLDHFFGLHLIGPAAVEQLRQRWIGAHDDYAIEVVEIQPTPAGAVVQLVNKGIFARDMLPKRAASGKAFACHACYVLKIENINGDRKIVRVDEYQPTYFDDQFYTERYVVRDGGKIQNA